MPDTLGVETSDPFLGTVVSGKYAILELLGEGGMGTVYLSENMAIGRRVALKLLNPAYAQHSEALERFEREARSAAKIGHPNIVEIFDMGRTDEGVPYIVMECLNGEELLKYMARACPMPVPKAADILTQVLGALDAAHQAGIVHRDLKPENVFLACRGMRTDFVKILDFGVAMFHDAEKAATARLTRQGAVLGTPQYMSPEQACGRSGVDSRSDLYAAGVLLYEMLSGRLPYEGDNYNEVVVAIASTDPPSLGDVAPWVPAEAVALVSKAMARDPAARFQTASEFAAALEPLLETVELEVPEEFSALATPLPSPATAPSTDDVLARAELDTARLASSPDRADGRPGRRFLAVSALLVAGAAGGFLYLRQQVLAGGAPLIRPPESQRAEHVEPIEAPRFVPVAPPPAETVAAQPMYSLDVSSNVRGAKVLLDGQPLGETPLHTVLAAQDGMHVLRVEAPGHEASERTIPLSAPLNLDVELAPVSRAKVRKGARGRQKRKLIFDEDVY